MPSRVKGEALGRFPKGETLWWVWAKPNEPKFNPSKKRANSPQGYEASGGSRLHKFPAKPYQAGSRAKPLAGFQRVKPFGGFGQSPTYLNSIPPKSERTARRAMRRASAAECIGAKAECAGPNPCPPGKRHGAAFRHDRTPRVAGAWALPLFCAKPVLALELMLHFAYFLRPVHIRAMEAWYDQSIRCGCAARVCGIGWSAGLGLPGCGAGPPCEHAARPPQRMTRRAYFPRFCMETHAQSPWKTFRSRCTAMAQPSTPRLSTTYGNHGKHAGSHRKTAPCAEKTARGHATPAGFPHPKREFCYA